MVRKESKFFWNMVGGICNALSSMILLIFVNRLVGSEQGGVFSLAFAIAQMLITFATLEVRNYQSTDLAEKYCFGHYLTFRILTCLIMIVISIGYILYYQYVDEKAYVIMVICIYKAIEAFSDVFEGLYQQRERIDLSGKAMAFRVIFSTAIFIFVLYITRDLLLACGMMTITSLIFCLAYNLHVAQKFAKVELTWDVHRFFHIFIECIPLALGAFMIMYIANAPKYAIDRYLDLNTQNIFSILFMPAFIINLFSLFVFRPMLTSITVAWTHYDKSSYFSILKRGFLWMLLVTAVCVGGAYLLGIPILSLLYKIDLTPYRYELVMIMLGGGLNAMMTIFRFSLTAMREQNISLLAFVLSFIGAIVFTPYLVQHYAIRGACYSYLLSMLVMNIVFFFIIVFKVRKWMLNANTERMNSHESF